MSTLDLVAEPLLEAGEGQAAARSRAEGLLARLNLPERLWHIAPATFSGGEQQRVNIARGFIRPSPILLLDEPTASLDGANRQVVIDLIREARGGAAIVAFSTTTWPAKRPTAPSCQAPNLFHQDTAMNEPIHQRQADHPRRGCRRHPRRPRRAHRLSRQRRELARGTHRSGRRLPDARPCGASHRQPRKAFHPAPQSALASGRARLFCP
ncbi:MAG: ATP-binding cassette domain-containing protein [Bilophila wadsworthia]